MRLLFLILLVLLNLTFTNAQAKYVPQEFIVQLAPGAELRAVLQDFAEVEGVASRMRLQKKLVPSSNIHLLHYDHTEISEETLLQALKHHPLILFAQQNHYVEMRSTLPNDPSFSSQWQHLNTGQLGGTVDMDMNSDLAWDLSTGGQTALGDTIVVAILDNGCELTHPDLAANIWYNYAEIPNNNIDDDQNGYVDDFKGWSTNFNDDNVDQNGGGIQHGTEIAGLIGAVGDNNLGVAGVNWTVKMMIIRNDFNTTEANVIAAYNYALQARRRYNQTNGQEGAFVVATNASWGIDNGQPANSPIWCAFYDTLGQAGILSSGATTNNFTNVDIAGDLPTTCPSDFLIGVTGHNRFGSLSGGYGSTHIDIGAPTGSVSTTSNNNNYTGFGGTSAAAPQVAAAIALAYAGACPDFISLARVQPQQAALAVRQALLNGHSPTGGLVGFTATGGRLNLDGMLQALPCPVDSCFAPQAIQIDQVSDSSIALSWIAASDSTWLYWRVFGSSLWQDSLLSPSNSANISNLLACQNYEIQLRAICDGVLGSSNSISVATLGCCERPTALQLDTASTNSGSFSWQAAIDQDSFLLRWQVYGDSLWDSLWVQGNSSSISGLSTCTYYKVQVQALCSDSLSPFSSPLVFATASCPNCANPNYCEMIASNSSADWIESFEIGGELFSSGNNGGYYFYDASNIQLSPESTIPFQIHQGNAFLEKIRIWIDINRDGDFSDAHELIYEGTLNFTSSLQDSISLPFIWPGQTRMRVALRWNNYPNLCEAYQNGEVEDYCVNILPPTAISNTQEEAPRLYPNPNDGSFFLDLKQADQLEVYNNLGQLVYQKIISEPLAAPHHLVLDPSLSAGIYYLHVQYQNKVYRQKFFKY